MDCVVSQGISSIDGLTMLDVGRRVRAGLTDAAQSTNISGGFLAARNDHELVRIARY